MLSLLYYGGNENDLKALPRNCNRDSDDEQNDEKQFGPLFTVQRSLRRVPAYQEHEVEREEQVLERRVTVVELQNGPHLEAGGGLRSI